MSITTEIERIQNAKASIKTAIENKGVEVGEGRIDTYASKIEEIVGSATEDLSNELTEQDALISEQEVTIEDIFGVLQGKMAGGEKIILEVENKTLILSKGVVEGGVLSL